MTTVIAAAADDAYAAPATVALLTAAKSVPEQVGCFFLDCGCRPETVERMRRAFDREHVALTVEPADPSLQELHEEAYVSRATYGTLFIPDRTAVLADRTLIVDADTLAYGDLSPLLHVELNAYAVGAVQDPRLRFVAGERGVPDWEARGFAPSLAYFNAGVLLVDNARWQRDRIGERTLTLVREEGARLPIVEQGALNATLSGEWWPLEPQWNLWARPHASVRLGSVVVSRRGAMELGGGAIFHFLDRFKPWHPDYPPSAFRRLYVAAHRRYANEVAPLPRWSVLRWAAARREILRRV